MERTDIVIWDSTNIARVSVNNVEVGSIPTQQLLALKKEAKRDWKLYLNQTLNYLYTSYSIVINIIQNIPKIWFAVALLLAIFDSNSITNIIALIQSNNADQNKDFFIYLLNRSALLSTMVFIISFSFSGGSLEKYGFENKFERYVARKLMKILEVPALGEIQITTLKKL